MTSTSTPRTPPVADRPDGSPSRRRFGLVVTLIVVLGLIFGWIYILFVYDPGLLIDELPDQEFPRQAEQVCAAARTELDALPPAQEAATPQERADAVEASNVILAAMVADLEPLVVLVPPDPPRYRDGTASWLEDWSSYLENRERYVDNLRVDDDARFLESSKGSPTKGITRAINGFAEVNEMASCATPGDLS